MKIIHSLIISCISLLFVSCASTRTNTQADQAIKSEYYTITKHYDEPSKTWYFLTKIDHKDKQGKLIKLRLALAEKDTGETVRQFAVRTGTMLAFNASTQRKPTPETKAPSGTQIVEGKIVQELPKNTYTLGIKANNELVAYPPGTSAASMLQDGAINALTAFIPLIEDHKNVHDSLLTIVQNFNEIHPRQVIAQFDNLGLLFLSCGGRGFDGEGMTSKDLMRVLQKLNVKFAYMLDGGGSTSTVVGKTLITKMIDEKGTQERTRPNFLYFMPIK